jgi:hypothetical protein
METNHEIFVEGNFVGEDGETTKRDICIQDAIKSMSYERWVKPTLEKYGPAVKDLYVLLVCIPSWTKEQRDDYINEYKHQIIDALNTLTMDYIDDLHVSIPRKNEYYTADQFKANKEYVSEQLKEELMQTA